MTQYPPLPLGGSDYVPYDPSEIDDDYFWACYDASLAMKHRGQVVAVYNRNVLAVADTPDQAMAAALKHPGNPGKTRIVIAPVLGPPLNPQDTVTHLHKNRSKMV